MVDTTLRVLVIDDEPTIRSSLRLALEAMGHVVDEAATGTESLDLVSVQAYDVAFVDQRLGEESGLAFLEPLQKRCSGLALIMITAYASVESAVEAMRKGALDYLAKPFTPAQVREVLDRVVHWRQSRNANNGQAGIAPARAGDALTLEALEVEHIRRILDVAPSLEAAARTLGIDPSTLYRKRKQYGL